MTTTNNAPISFRLADDELELLRQHQEDGEKSLNLTAKRLLLNALGIDAKKPSIHPVDIVDSIRTEINESIADGDIKDAIANSYKAAMGQFNGLLQEMQELKKQVEELKSNPPAPPAPIPHSPITNHQSPITNDELIELLGIRDIIGGQIYNFDSLKEDGIIASIKENQELIEVLIGDKMSLKNDLSDMNKILKFMGFSTERTTKDNKKYNRAKMPK
jgi:hypothetical protein